MACGVQVVRNRNRNITAQTVVETQVTGNILNAGYCHVADQLDEIIDGLTNT